MAGIREEENGRITNLSLYGFSISCMPRKAQLALLAAAMLSCHLLHGIFTEHVARDILGGLMWAAAAMELTIYTMLSGIELVTSSESVKWAQLPWKRYIIIAVAIATGRGLTWVALGSLTYPTVLLFKSSKIIVVMFSAVVILRKRFLPAEYAAALLAVTGLYTFSCGDRMMSPRIAAKDESTDSFQGVGVMLCAVGAEALVSTLQEYCLRKLKRSLSEVLFVTNGIGAFLLVTVSFMHGDAHELHARLSQSWDLGVWVTVTVTLAYGGTYAFTSCIQGFGAIVATGLGILRKLLSVVLSFLLFPKPFGTTHGVGLAVFFSGLVLAWSADWDKRSKSERASQVDKAAMLGEEEEDSKGKMGKIRAMSRLSDSSKGLGNTKGLGNNTNSSASSNSYSKSNSSASSSSNLLGTQCAVPDASAPLGPGM